jgi:hypothetical protein
MKRFLAYLVPTIVVGCVTNSVDPNIPPNVVLTAAEAYNARYIESVRFNLDSEHFQVNPTKCVALNVDNKEYSLSGSSRSLVGAYTGNIYRFEKQHQAGGGQSLVYSDATSAISKGSVDGTFMFGFAPITKIVSFKVEVNTAPSKHFIAFTDIQSAHKATGVASNDGFSRVGAWSGAKPVFVYNLLNKIAGKLKDCLVSL